MPAAINDDLKPYQLLAALEEYEGATSLQDVSDGYLTVVKAARPYTCPKCKGVGKHALSLDTLDSADTDLIECTMEDATGAVKCSGYGYLTSNVKLVPPSGLPTYEITT